jgi:hypothetical protein
MNLKYLALTKRNKIVTRLDDQMLLVSTASCISYETGNIDGFNFANDDIHCGTE